MIAVFMTVRNRLAVTKKCIEALYRNTRGYFHLFVFDNLTSHKVGEHFNYFRELYEQGRLHKYVVNTMVSTFGAFSKATSFNEFGLYIETNPHERMYDFLLCLDNDIIIIEPGWDTIVEGTFKAVDEKDEKNAIQIVTQYPGGCSGVDSQLLIGGTEYKVRYGFQGGSGFWSLRPDFFAKVGLLEPGPLVGINKRHDIHYWQKLSEFAGNRPYVCAVDHPMALHFSYHNGKDLSICKASRNDPMLNVVHEDVEELVDSLTQEEFIAMLKKDQEVLRKW